MSRSVTSCALIVPLVITLAGCGATPEGITEKPAYAIASSTPSWNRYYVAGSRIPRKLDAQGQPLTGSHIVTISDDELKSSAGVLLGDKLTGGYPR
jgi:starvation-inducible outer membrane lipoprotein